MFCFLKKRSSIQNWMRNQWERMSKTVISFRVSKIWNILAMLMLIDIVCFPVKSVKHRDLSMIPIYFVKTVFCFFYSFYRNVDNARSHMLCSVWIVFNSGYVEKTQSVFFCNFYITSPRFLSSCSFNYLLIVKCVCGFFL